MADVQYDANPLDWSTFSTSTVLEAGYMLWFYNNSEYGVDTRFHVIGDGSTTVANLNKFLPVSAEAGTERLCRPESEEGESPSPFVRAYKLTDDELKISINWGRIAKQDASDIVYSGASTDSFRISQADNITDVISFADGAISNLIVDGDMVRFVFTLTDAFLDLAGSRGCDFLVQSIGAKFTLS